MSSQVPAEELSVGDLIELFTMYGEWLARLVEIYPRANGIKCVGRRADDGRTVSFGMRYGDLATRPEQPPESPPHF